MEIISRLLLKTSAIGFGKIKTCIVSPRRKRDLIKTKELNSSFIFKNKNTTEKDASEDLISNQSEIHGVELMAPIRKKKYSMFFRTTSLRDKSFIELIPEELRRSFAAQVKPFHMLLDNTDKTTPLRINTEMDLVENYLDNETCYIDVIFSVTGVNTRIKRKLKAKLLSTEQKSSNYQDPWTTLRQALLDKIPDYSSDLNDELKEFISTSDNFIYLEDLEKYTFSKEKLAKITDVALMLRHFFKSYFGLISGNTGKRLMALNSETLNLFKLKQYFKERYVLRPLAISRRAALELPNDYALFKYLGLEKKIIAYRKKEDLREYRVKAIPEDEGSEAVIKGARKLLRTRSSENIQEATIYTTYIEKNNKNALRNIAIKAEIIDTLKTHGIEEVLERRASKFGKTLKAILKFKRNLKIYRGWKRIEIPQKNVILQLATHVYTLLIKFESLFWLCQMGVYPRSGESHTDNILEDFQYTIHFSAPLKAKSFQIKLLLSEMEGYLKLPKKLIIEYIGRRLNRAKTSKRFERRFLKIIRIKLSRIANNLRTGDIKPHQPIKHSNEIRVATSTTSTPFLKPPFFNFVNPTSLPFQASKHLFSQDFSAFSASAGAAVAFALAAA